MTLEHAVNELVLKNSSFTEEKYSIARDFINTKIHYLKEIHKIDSNLKKVNEHNYHLLENYSPELLEIICNALDKYNNIYELDEMTLRTALTNILNQLYSVHRQKMMRKPWLSICCEYIMNMLKSSIKRNLLKKEFKLDMKEYLYDIDINLFYELNRIYAVLKSNIKQIIQTDLTKTDFTQITLVDNELFTIVSELCLYELLIYNTEYIKEQNKLFNYKISSKTNINEQEYVYDALDELFGMIP